MASFTYSVWFDSSVIALVNQLQIVFGKIGFSIKNPRSGKIHLWLDEEIEIDPDHLSSISDVKLPVGIQWWRGEDDIYASISESREVGGLMCQVSLVGFTRDEQAEIARLLIINVTPEKQNFPDDFYVFRLSAQ